MRRFWPQSLASQIALLIAVALFIAQAINFALLLQVRRQAQQGALIGPTIARVADIEERIAEGRFRPGPRARARLLPANPLPPTAERRAEIEAPMLAALRETGLRAQQVVAALRPIDPNLVPARLRQARLARYTRGGLELVIAIERPEGNWLVLRAPWPRGERGLFWGLITQTVILYLVLLIALIWATRRVSRPLRALADAARRFQPGERAPPLIEEGPTDVRAVTIAFNALRDRVGAMLDEKDRMLGAIGHDLRTPLAALRVRIESVEDDTDRTKMAETIDEMSRTLDDILSLARLGRPSEPLTETDLGALVEAVVDDFDALGARVSFEATPRVTLRLRPALMRRAVRNLVENAVKYAGSAEVRLVARAAEVAVVVADRGPGIPEDRIEAVFDAFTRLEGSRNRETGGAGLGLALARAIVREAGGDIELANRAGGGLEATILLPRR